jgi:hypothetical protein
MRIDTYEKLLAMFLLQVANLPTYKGQVGATNDDITAVTEAAAVLQYLADYLALVDANKRTVTKIKQTVYNGDPDEAITPFPVFPAGAPPFALIAGLSELANKRNRRFKAADGYTKEIGIALGIDGDAPSIAPESVKPTLEVTEAQGGYEAAIVVGNRGKSSMWRLLGRKMNSETWSVIDSGTGKGASVTIPPTTPGMPERMELKIQLYKDNEPYGQPSDPMYATFNP